MEKRKLQTTTVLTKHLDWKGLQQGFELIRERVVKGEKTVQKVYGITSLSESRADAARLLQLTRDHWKIENRLHYVRDVTLGEDASRVRLGSAPQTLAAVRNAVIHLLSTVDASNKAAAIRRLNAQPEAAMKLLDLPQLE